MRVVLDANVLVSALLSREGVPARLVELWLGGRIEVIVCELLLEETGRTLRSPKLGGRVEPEEADRYVALLRELGELVPDPDAPPPVRSPDPGDDYLLALAAREGVPLVTGDGHLLGLAGVAPVHAPRDFLSRLLR